MTIRSKGQRQSRFTRHKRARQVILQPRDIDIIVAAFQSRFLTREQIQWMFDISCVTVANRILRRLFDAGFLDRRFLPLLQGSSQAMYFLGQRGMPIVSERLNLDPDEVARKRRRDQALRTDLLEHERLINDFRIRLETETLESSVSIERFLHARECECKFGIRTGGREVKYYLKPDGYFELKSSRSLSSYFLEIDRSTSGLRKLSTKFKTYRAYREAGLIKKLFNRACFTVLIVTLSPQRATNLVKLAEKLQCDFFYFSSQSLLTEQGPLGGSWVKPGSTTPVTLPSINLRRTER